MKRDQAKLATKIKVLEVAESSFIETDFKATTAQIAGRAGIAHGTIFFHFKDRDELVLAVVRHLVPRITNVLYEAYRDSKNLQEFLTRHLDTVRSDWPIFKSLFSGFSDFSEETKQEVVSLLSVINYYLIEAFNRWTDHGFLRTMLWQGSLVYLSFLGDYMFDKNKISEKFVQALIPFISRFPTTKDSTDKLKKPKRKKKLCMSCGMLLDSQEDYPMGDTSKDYCRYCEGEDGVLKSFDDVCDTMTTFLQSTQVLNSETARQAAFAILAKNPAWKEYVKKYY